MAKKKLELVGNSKAVIADQAHMDGWQNLVTSLGTNNDKRMYASAKWENHPPEFYEQLYSGDELASRIVNVVPEEALRRFVSWENVKKNVSIGIDKRIKDLDLKAAVEKTWKWARAYGGACLYIVTDTSTPSEPLRPGEKVIGLRDLSRWDLRILTTDVETDFGSPNFGCPNIYYLTVQVGSKYKGYPIHWTRMVRFDGYLVPRRTYIRNNYWHDSVLNRLYNAIRNYQTSNDAVATILQDFNVDVYKMKSLANLMSAGKESVVKARIEMIQFAKSVLRAMILDSDEEEYENVGRSVEGVAELLTKQANRLVAATDIPHTKLLGESPDGSNATGNSTTQQWYDHVQSEQENYFRPKLQRLIDVIFPDIQDLGFKFKSLNQLTELEEVEKRNKQANTDKLYADMGAVDPSEITESRFGGEEYTIETVLDKEGREAGLIGPGSGQDLLEEQPNDKPPEDDGTPPPSGGKAPSSGGQGGKAQPPPKMAANRPVLPPSRLTGRPAAVKSEEQIEAEEDEALPESLKPFTPNPQGIENDQSGTQYGLQNEVDNDGKNIKPKTKAFISQTMSEPMRDPRTDPKIKPGGVPVKPRKVGPETTNSVTANKKNYRADSGESAMMPRQLDQVKGVPISHAASIAVRSENRLLMGRRKDSQKWTLPGGKGNDGEEPMQTALRELEEETGIKAKAEDLMYLGSKSVRNPNGIVEVHAYMLNTAQNPATGKKDPDNEVQKWRWMDTNGGLPQEIKTSLHHDKNIVLDLLGLL